MKLSDIVRTTPPARGHDLGLLVARLVLAWVFLYHGSQKLFGWFDGGGPAGTGDYFAGLGLAPGQAWAVLIGLLELAGGLSLAVGLLARVFGALLALEMLAIIVKVNWANGLIAEKAAGGYEINLSLGALGLLVALLGAGAWSLDAALQRRSGAAPLTVGG
jgi:putative oxidoreductase